MKHKRTEAEIERNQEMWKAVYECLRHQGKTWTSLAAEIDMATSTLTTMHQEGRSPSFSTMMAILHCLGFQLHLAQPDDRECTENLIVRIRSLVKDWNKPSLLSLCKTGTLELVKALDNLTYEDRNLMLDFAKRLLAGKVSVKKPEPGQLLIRPASEIR